MFPRPWFGLCLALASHALAQGSEAASPTLRHDLVRFQAPPVWSCRTVGGEMVLTPEEEGLRLVVEHSKALAESLEDHLARRVADYASRAGYGRQGERQRTRVPATGVEFASELFLLQATDGGGARPGVWLILLGGGGRVAGLRCEFDSPEAFGRHGDAVTRLVNAARLGTLERLERGRPPLLRYMVDEATAFLEWLVQSPFTDEQVATVEAELRASWRAKDREEIDGAVELLQARQELAALTAEARELARVQVLEQCLASWREEQATSRGAAMMLAIHASVDRELLGKAIASQADADAAARQAAVDRQRASIEEVLRIQQETRRIRASMHSVNISFPQPYRW